MEAKQGLGNEGAIQKVLDDWADALRARDLGRIKSFYGTDLVAYDAIPPLQYRDPETFFKNWEMFFEYMPGETDFERRDLKIVAGDNAAFAFSLVNLIGTNKEGKKEGAWMRGTIGFEKRDGRWLITHEHWSAPFDMETMKVAMDLKPE